MYSEPELCPTLMKMVAFMCVRPLIDTNIFRLVDSVSQFLLEKVLETVQNAPEGSDAGGKRLCSHHRGIMIVLNGTV